MARFKKGDRVIITEGDLHGQWGTIVDKDIIGDELTVALGDSGREIRTHEGHVRPGRRLNPNATHGASAARHRGSARRCVLSAPAPQRSSWG